MRTKDFVAAIEAAFERAYSNGAGFTTVPYEDRASGEVRHCLGLLLSKGEHFAVVVANAAHWIAEDPDSLFLDTMMPEVLDRLEDFHNLVSGMHTAPYMQWTCVYFPGLTEEQVLGATDAGDEPTIEQPKETLL